MGEHDLLRLNRRELLKLGGAVLLGCAASDVREASASDRVMSSCSYVPDAEQLFQSPCAGQGAIEVYPTSPFILEPFRYDNELPIPPVLAPEVLYPAPGYGVGQQASDGSARSTHQIKPADLGLPDPVPDPNLPPAEQAKQRRTYHITLKVAKHSFTNSKVEPIDQNGNKVPIPPEAERTDGYLPDSSIFGFNGTFPGSRINARYGQPVIVRFENQINPKLAHGNFGSPKGEFLTHLHNGHTAPESDGNPHCRPESYHPGEWVDNLYLNYPPGGDDNEKQSFLWFHDHSEGYTGANVYKGLVGLYPIYDEEDKLDPGDETKGLHLPGVRRNYDNGTFAVDYDIPLALYDCVLDDGATRHQDFHTGCGETHPEWWGKTFFKHFPNHGFVGDIFTVNGKAFPVLNVFRRKYRFRFLDASIARVYDLMLMTSDAGPQAVRGTQGQWLIPDGKQCMRFTQIASEGGLLPYPIVRDSFEIWPSRRKEVIVDFTNFAGKEIYLVNIAKMEDGRKPDSADPNYKVPVLKIIVGGPPPEPDMSVIPRQLRPLPNVDLSDEALAKLPHRYFELQRGGGAKLTNPDPVTEILNRETEWLINDHPFQICEPLARPQKGGPEVWTVKNGGGGWIHPMHFHQEEHRIIAKNGVRFNSVTPSGADDAFAKEDTISLGPGDEVVFYRNFRTFPSQRATSVGVTGKYVAHCHNLAHEDHNMMFGWEIINPKIL
jgi:FtsP/CotA-like multicopper oxidase with cupredoxin domain